MFTINVSQLRADGRVVLACHTLVASLSAALRIADSHAPAPLNPATRERLRREHGGEATVGQVRIAIGCEA